QAANNQADARVEGGLRGARGVDRRLGHAGRGAAGQFRLAGRLPNRGAGDAPAGERGLLAVEQFVKAGQRGQFAPFPAEEAGFFPRRVYHQPHLPGQGEGGRMDHHIIGRVENAQVR
ncbi:hypothetical protein RZS08_48125, partial [Arthrospira platensis SPKY1]|nr:hypothetical protein [Arthrospira platensis SPKY1]